MNNIASFFFKSWIRCVLTLVALGAVLIAVQQGMSRLHRTVDRSASQMQEARDVPDHPAEAGLPQAGIQAAAATKESSSVSSRTNVVAPVSPTSDSAPAHEGVAASTVSGRTIPPPLYRAVKADRNGGSAGVGSSGNSGTPTVDPPLVFLVDPKNLTRGQQTTVATIQDQFLKAVGGTEQDPADPAYRRRWMDAEDIADQTYKALFGWSAFSQMQLERARNSYTAIQLP